MTVLITYILITYDDINNLCYILITYDYILITYNFNLMQNQIIDIKIINISKGQLKFR